MEYIENPQYREYHDTLDVGEYALAAAIVMQAIEDYRYAKGYLNGTIKMTLASWKRRFVKKPESLMLEINDFFNSRWYGTLCDIPKERIFTKLFEE